MQLIVLVVLVVIGVLLLQRLIAHPPSQLAKSMKKIAWAVAIVAVLLLLATGRLNVVLAAMGVTVAYLFRVLPIILSHAPSLHRLWQLFNQTKSQSSQQSQGQQPFHTTGKMTVAEAYQVLGLQPNASEDQIVAAHRKLMQKNHPDRGGSDYLAAKINLAKKTLINK